MATTLARCLVVLLLASAPLGCGGKPGQSRTVPVGGKVTHNGKPVPNAMVTFHGGDGAQSPSATTDEQGRFHLTTYEEKDGAPVGDYQVTVLSMDAGGRNPIPEKYADPGKTPLNATVTDAGANEIPLELK